jgi:hypothetical protein
MSAVILENYVLIVQKLKHRITLWFSNITWYGTKRNEFSMLLKWSEMQNFHNSQAMEKTKVAINGGMSECENVIDMCVCTEACIYNGILYCLKRDFLLLETTWMKMEDIILTLCLGFAMIFFFNSRMCFMYRLDFDSFCSKILS